jgi:hypothetical protein
MAIMQEHDAGLFQRSAGLFNEVMTDDRCYGVINTRVGAIKSAPLKVVPAGTKRKEKQVAEYIGGTNDKQGIWRQIVSQATLGDLLKWGLGVGAVAAEIAWQRSPTEWIPRLIPWHPEHLRWDDWTGRFILQARENQIVLPRVDEHPLGDGQWFVWCPWGWQYGWQNALIRPLAFKYLSRSWNERDWNRWTERQGLGIIKGITPGNNPAKLLEFLAQLTNLGSDPVVVCPQTADGKHSFDVKVEEFQAPTWQGMMERKNALDPDIAITVLGQNLSTEVKEGSRAAAQVTDKVRIDYALTDAAIGEDFKSQILTWYCQWNLGDQELAPTPVYEVAPPDDELGEAQALKTLGEAAQALVLAEPRTDVTALMEAHGVPLISEEELAAREAEAEAEGGEPEAGGSETNDGSGEPNAGEDETAEDEPGADKDSGAGSAAEGLSIGTPAVRKRYVFAGLPIAVENPAGTIRSWTALDGTAGHTRMLWDYGYIEGFRSGDDEEIDCYVGPDEAASHVYVVRQMLAPEYRVWDEDKVMLGFPSYEFARMAYLDHRNDGERALGGIVVKTLEQFKATLRRRRPSSTTKIHASLGAQRQAATAAALMELAARGLQARRRRTVAGERRASKYQELLIDRALRVGARALAPDLAAIVDLIKSAPSLEALPGLIKRKYASMVAPAKLEEIIRKTNLMARLSGMNAALEQV